MVIPTLVMAILAVVLTWFAWRMTGGVPVVGFQSAIRMTWTILPMLILAFIVAGMIQVLVPPAVISRWVGAESGFRGILIGAVAGGFAPGGPYVSLPIAAALVKSGAGTGTMVAFLTGWSLWAVARLPMEIGILGWQLTVARFVSTLVFPPLAGWIAHLLFQP
ncbi:permease [bacterium]|nr:permease [candidate division CSSED10-310 bacterium]